MKLLTAAQMREADRRTIEDVGIPALVLMELAGREIAAEVRDWTENRNGGLPASAERLPAETEVRETDRSLQLNRDGDSPARRSPAGRRWLILCGKGNNGGDGLAAARHLQDAGYAPHILYAVPPESLTGEAARQRDWARQLQIPASVYGESAVDWAAFDGAVDALLGTGTKGEPREPYASVIREANRSGLPIIAADLPSGLDADTGRTHDSCIKAMRTVTLGACKMGLAVYPGAEAAGRVRVAYIGIPETVFRGLGGKSWLLDGEVFSRVLGISPDMPRAADTHKGTYGHTVVAAGSLPMSGAGILSASAALRSGSGLVTWTLPRALAGQAVGAVPEAMLWPLDDEDHGDWAAVDAAEALAAFEGKQAAVIGPGMGRFVGDRQWIVKLWREAELPCVFDADALNMLSAHGMAGLPARSAPVVLTPHPGEMARLRGCSTAEVQSDRIAAARDFAVRHHLVLVLKGARTLVAGPDGEMFVNPTGNPGMATGGTGDVLAGLIGGLLAQGLTALQAAALGVWLHGRAGDLAAQNRQRPSSLAAGDLLHYL